MATDYATGKVYAVRCHDDPGICYVGSTVRTLTRRMDGHRASARNGRVYGDLGSAMLKFGPDRFYIELLEEYPCGCREELERKEGDWARQLATLNRKTPGRTSAEYKTECHERVLQAHREYNSARKDNISRLIDCGCGVRYTASNQWNHSKSAKHQAWAATQPPPPPKPPPVNGKEKHTCECGGRYTHYNKLIHVKTGKHLAYLASLTDTPPADSPPPPYIADNGPEDGGAGADAQPRAG